MQWLINAAEKAGWKTSNKPALAPQATSIQAWSAVAKAYNVSEAQLAEQVAKQYSTGVADLYRAEDRAVKLVPEKLARKFILLPLHETQNEIVVATADPGDYEAEQAVQFTSGRRVIMRVAPPSAIVDALNLKFTPERAMESLLQSVDTRIADQIEVLEADSPESVATEEAQATPVIRLTNMILHAAIAAGASDIHIEPGRQQGTVRFRVDGVLRQYMQLPLQALNRVVSRIKVIGKLDIADRLRPQDGRTRISVDGKAFDMRLSTVPTREAEKAVIRILNPDTSRTLDEIGLSQHELTRLKYLLGHREGIVVVTGPTGSGKTTTLYGGIRELAGREVNIMTVEDPVEYELAGVTQIQIDPKRDVTFASALRAILRQDPDVVFVGEIRDTETAHVALQAAMTGHLVLSTLHTNDAVGVIQRMVDLGLDRTSLAAALRGALGQRLIRRLCKVCREPQPAERDSETERLERAFGAKQVNRPVGCQQCGESGYRGRLPLTEVLVSSAEFQELVSRGGSHAELQRAAERGGMRTIRQVALEWLATGETSLQEIERVLGEGEAPTGTTGAADSKEPSRVLVIDDDPLMRELAVGALEQAGFTVESAVDGKAGLDILTRDNGFALVALDLNMPNMGGREVLKRLRASVATASIPVIILTGGDGESTEIELMESGADDYLAKPYDPARFLARVRAVLRRAAAT